MTTPLLPFSKINRWGLHYHGKVQNSLLTLPNASTITWAQPSNSNVSLVKFASTPPVAAMSPEQASKGQQYLNYALITASKIGQKTLDGQFIYRDTGGKVWLIKIEVSSWAGATVNLNITYSRFGLIKPQGSEFEQHVKPLSIATGLPTPSSYGVSFENSAPTGKKCCLRVTASGNRVAYLEITLNDLTPSGVVAKTKEDALVYTVDQSTVSSGLLVWTMSGSSSTGYNHACPASDGLSHSASNQANVVQASKGGNDVISEITIDRIVGAFYDKAGDLKFVSLKSKSTYNQILVDMSSGSGGLVKTDKDWTSETGDNAYCTGFRWNVSGSPVKTTITGLTFGEDSFNTRKLEVDLLVDGSPVSSLYAEYTTSQWGRATGDFTAGNGTVDPTLPAPNLNGGTMINRVDTGAVYPVIDTPIDSTINSGSMQLFLANIHTKHVDAYADYVANGNSPTGAELEVLQDGASTNYHILDTAISNNARYLVYGHDLLNNATTSGLADVRFSEVVHPEGSDGSIIRGDRAIRSGAFQPETEEVVRNQANAVSFV